MLPQYKQKTLAALKRVDGLSKKVASMMENDAYCPKILEQVLAMQGHMKHIQALVLESHLHTCAPKKLRANKDRNDFIRELSAVIGLSTR